MGILDYIQYGLGRALYPVRGHDSRQIIHHPAFKDVSAPNMLIEAPECGPSGSMMLPKHSGRGEDLLPELRWMPPESNEPVKEYVLICEDIDIPLPLVIHHGLFWAIPPSVTSAVPANVAAKPDVANQRRTDAGWRFIPNPMGTSYGGPAPPFGHGPHRYVFTIIALNDTLQFSEPEKASKDDIKNAMVGKVIGWGQWIGVFERIWGA
ncbi:hypothetical protein N7532_009850 [Penicillium argentinense]|uniref:PEBP-like protein n=1 Tax=Penicillium argentinense TaxID=1131581 RepID=A0A9W9JX32_9EURO|nr:uncharacterized protein N7532_009850 [Penicillium argentinense]KAJ5085079.1 hypothetical protein N7532_009850 [Penicillium argentinense]